MSRLSTAMTTPDNNSGPAAATEQHVVKRILAGLFAAATMMAAQAVHAAPTVNINEPSATATFVAPADVPLTAFVSSTNGTPHKVSYYNGTTLIATAQNEPVYSSMWNDVPAGSYTINATATDYLGNVIATAPPRQITVKPNLPPTVSINAPGGDDDVAPATIVLTAVASDPEGSVLTIDYYRDGVWIGKAPNVYAPYAFSWSGVAPGTYSVTARVTDQKGAMVSSAPVTVVVKPNVLPAVAIIAPGNNATFAGNYAQIELKATASDKDGTIVNVSYYDGDAYIGNAWTAPYTVYWRNVYLGSYRITARALDNKGGVTVSTPFEIAVIPNVPPVVSLTSPANNATFVTSAIIPFAATATDSDGTVEKVDFYVNGVYYNSRTVAPFKIDWSTSVPGTYSITARAFDNSGDGTLSLPHSITVVMNQAPTVALTAPVALARFVAPATIALAASATDSDGTVAKVDFYNGAILIGSASTAPYTLNWSNVAGGTYSVTARATDDLGGVKTSLPLAIEVVTVPFPTVSVSGPANNASFISPASFTLTANAAVSGDTISKVDYFSGDNLVGTATVAPYAVSLSGIGEGTYLVSARATGALGGITTSAPISLVVNDNSAPVVTLDASPANAVVPAVITMGATASDSDGSVVKVEFFNGATLLATATQAPYSYVWNGVGANSYQLTARATDDRGAQSTSAVRTVAVTAAGTITRVFYVYSDQINTAREITNAAGAMVWQADPEPFGVNMPNENPAGQGQFTYNPRFPGQYFDRETGLHYNYYRDYDPQTGRYVQSDPIGLAGGMNTFGYVGGNPVSATDPFGLDCSSQNQSTACKYPTSTGPSFRVPKSPDWDSFSSWNILYHKYHVSRNLGAADAKCVEEKLRNNPTPKAGKPKPATSGGTINNAKVPPLAMNNLVTSYLTSDLRTGGQVVVNMTGPGSSFGDGYVARTVSGGQVHTYGEGTAYIQSAFIPELAKDAADEYVWGKQMEEFIKECTCSK
jgi:RHS repeat-associated protein